MQYPVSMAESKKRLQITLSDSEYQAVLNAARKKGMSVSQWIREALSASVGFEAKSEMARKLEALRVAATYEFPTGSIETMLADIEKGYTRD
jgi:hypothetical protein